MRHGQSTWNAAGRVQGSSNLAVLTPKGIAQAETTHELVGSATTGYGTTLHTFNTLQHLQHPATASALVSYVLCFAAGWQYQMIKCL